MFEKFGIPGISFASQAGLAMYATGSMFETFAIQYCENHHNVSNDFCVRGVSS